MTMPYPPLGAQLIVFSQQADLERDTEAVLDAVKAAGFGAIEIGVDLHASDPEAFKAMLGKRRIKVAGAHGGVEQDLDTAFKIMEAYDTRDLCISGVGGWQGRSTENYLKDIETLNKKARVCYERGFYLHYHNHAYEFGPTDGGLSGMELILGNLDNQVADLCVDVAWVHIGGDDPAIFLRKYANMIGYVHLKDYFGDRHWVELGQGVVPFDSIMRALGQLPRARWAVYEQDTSDRAAAISCAISHKYLVDTFGYG
jgi:sugar phosphate isomerase/epimerase